MSILIAFILACLSFIGVMGLAGIFYILYLGFDKIANVLEEVTERW